MSSVLERRLEALAGADQSSLLTGIRRGIEKESLRVTPEGRLAQTPHPAGLGSALTHPYITTDYAEALLEFITPATTSIETALRCLDDIHRYVYANLDDELLWCASMPCVLGGDANIPVAQYGSSNVATMKTVYRYGLGHRYGRLMQTIAGIHYNFSMPDAFWPLAMEDETNGGEIQDFITDRYLGLIRNFRRRAWLLVYLFGASPAVCSSFLRGSASHGLEPFDEQARSYYTPYGTALRMGDLGYSSKAQNGLAICYNQLDTYIATLREAITTPHPDYERIGVGENGHELQLNTSLLQIENEFYSPIRPKRVTNSGEIPLGALRRGGIEYIEVRCVDVNPFHPLGLDAEEAHFIDLFLLHCLLDDSAPCDDDDRARVSENMLRIVNRGREPGLALVTVDGEQPMQAIAGALMDDISRIAGIMDTACGGTDYSDSWRAQQAKLEDPGKTPSARILAQMREQDIPFFRLAMNASLQWSKDYRSRPLSDESLAHFTQASERSVADQAAVEAADNVDFETYLATYYRQYDGLNPGPTG